MGLAKDWPTRSARSTAYQLVGLQAIVVAVVALGWLINGGMAAFSVMLGGTACVLPSFYFARRLFSTTSARARRQIVKTFYLGELLKLLSSAGLLVMIILLAPVSILPLISGFIGAQFGFWLAPFWFRVMGTEKVGF